MNDTNIFDIKNRKNLTWFYPKICKFQDKTKQDNYFQFLNQEGICTPLLLYLHIPFCESFCSYCACFKENFYTYSYEMRQQFTDAIIQELVRYFRSPYLKNATIQYILFGGGSPSVLDNELLEKVLVAIHKNCNLKDLKGISFEGNVMSLKDESKLKILKNHGVNRISFGLQTFQPKIRKILNIKAPLEDVYDTVNIIHKVGIPYFTLDKIYNLPEETMDTLEDDLERIYNELNPSIIQTYRLNTFNNTKLAEQIKNKVFDNLPSDEKEMEMFEFIQKTMKAKGYSNQIFINMYSNKSRFADTGIELSIGNNRLFGSNMLGLGPGSMSYLSGYNYRNVCSVKEYMDLINRNLYPMEAGHKVGLQEMENRTMVFFPNFMKIAKSNIPSPERFKDSLELLLQNTYLTEEETNNYLTDKGKLWAGDISFMFYSDTEKGRVQLSFVNSIRHHKNPFNQDDMNC